MENNFDNSHSDLIYLFLDREASPLEQEILFKALSESSDLRAEFENALEIYSGFKSDKNNLNPPVHLATSIFSSAGMTYPYGYNSSVPGSPVSKGFLPKLKNLFKPVMMMFLGALISFVAFILFNSNNDSIYSTSKGILSADSFILTQQNLINSYFANKTKDIITIAKNTTVSDNFAVSQSFESENIIIPDSETQPISFQKMNSSEINLSNNTLSLASLKFNDDLSSSKDLISLNLGKTSPLFLNEKKISPDFYLEIKGNTNINQFPVASQNFSINQIYENLGLAFYYKIGKNNLLGAFVAQEPFSIYRVNDPEYKYDFTPVSNLLTFGASYRQLIPVFDLNGYLTPFVDVSTGFSEYGAITKGAIGLNLNPNNMFNFVIGLDGTMLFYKFKGNIQTTEKISVFFNFGFNI